MAIKVFFKKCLSLAALTLLLSGCVSNNSSSSSSNGEDDMKDQRHLNAIDYAFSNLCGEDALGRQIKRINGLKKDKTRYVGMFYSLWLGGHKGGTQQAVYDITELEKTPEGAEALNDLSTDPGNPNSPVGQFHFWGQPLYGYYDMSDPFVVTRHIELFLNAGLDYLCIDATNSVLYYDATFNLLNLLMKFQKQGYDVPKVMFYTNSHSGPTVKLIYNKFYKSGEYDSVWFAPNGKPMIIGVTIFNENASDQTKYASGYGWEESDFVSEDFRDYFDIKESEWPNGDHNENSIPWMSWQYPQRVHTESNSICVDVAQHSHSKINVSSKDPECHRGYNNITKQVEGDWKEGLSFQQMWNTALEDKDNNINNVLVCSFNEWMAIKQPTGAFVDVYDQEYSRDIEMTREGYKDNYYLQLVENIRNYKYEDFVKYEKEETTISFGETLDPKWNDVVSQYQDLEEDAINRDHSGAVHGLNYKLDSKRNDIKLVKVTNDKDYIYFYIECVNNLVSYNGVDQNYMNILLKTKESSNNFMGCNVLINRKIEGNKGSIEISKGGYDWEKVDEAELQISGSVMQIKLPRRNIETNDTCDFEFKVFDNVLDPTDEMEYYVSGDVMPLGRMRYGY